MSEEKELIKKRGSFKGRLTVFSNYLDGLLDTSLEGDDVSELQLRLRRMESMYEPYDEVQMRLECIVDDVQSQMSERSEFESLYYKTLSRAKNMLSNYNKEIQSQHSDRASIHKPVKLPTIQLPKFNGNYNNWLEFRDTFTSLIHHNDEIDDINKFHYLRASLEGSAAVVIQSIEFSMTNYSVAWNLLCDRFDNTNLLIQNHISALFNIEVISKESSVALKGLIDQLNKNLRALESLGEPVKHWDTLLIYIITRKLDQKTFREWEEFKGRLGKDKPVLFEAFMRFIRNRADLVETLELSRNNSSHTPTKSSSKFKSLVTTQSPNDSSNYMSPKVCPNCKGNHNLNSCSHFLALTNEARLKLLPSYKICYNCFRTGHFANQCKKPGCKLCKRKHNILIHISHDKFISKPLNEGAQNNVASNESSSPCSQSSSDTNNIVTPQILRSARISTAFTLLSCSLFHR
ncbi:hypothetical protein K1T71_011125 [Dendrolimus kikuchii]|uniref:Uncharacterized protein n=1 Tax=Dendrolimus kikuchii TaxID=765133 RepID=A0ACC1CMY3_9NEOP|nr:hypothetical protein K1T71_011125 [Dendrolimus kikuchii]